MFAKPKKQITEQEALLKLSALCSQAEHLTSSLKKHAFYNLLINNILYLCVT